MTRISSSAIDPTGSAGFTLMEMLVVLAIMSLLIGLASSSLLRGPSRMKDRTALAEVTGKMRAARLEALRSGTSQKVASADLSAGGLIIHGSGAVQDQIIWKADGSSTGGTAERAGRIVLSVDALTGTVHAQ